MTQPVIARRCQTCGASLREADAFCPQCGGELPWPQSPTQPTPAQDSVNQVTQPLLRDTVALDQPKPAIVKEQSKERSERKVGQAALGSVGARIHRATTIARDVEGDVVHRVQKVREISSVVIGEAAYDPSLRFVLVAAAIFVVFLVIVLLNKLIS